MKNRSKSRQPARISDAAVQAKTGKNWEQWFTILDATGARNKNHKDIVTSLDKYKIGPWWQQMVTITYEQQRGKRRTYQKPSGYEISRSRTVGVPLSSLYRSWKNEQLRSRWLPVKGITIRKATLGKSMRITWSDGKTSLEVYFYPRGKTRSQVTVQHSKLPSQAAANRMQQHWTKNLDRLKGFLET